MFRSFVRLTKRAGDTFFRPTVSAARKTCDARVVLRRSSAPFVAFALSAFFASAPALAQAPRERDRELETLEKNLTDATTTLSTSDCATACRALASIRRAADKICALDSGERCAAGRARADDATRRVREACPECAIASAPPAPPAPSPEREERAMTKTGSDAAPTSVASSPPAEAKRGGCAGCVTAPTSDADLTTAALAVVALASAIALRRRKRPTPSQ